MAAGAWGAAQAASPALVDAFEGKPRLIVLTDIGNEPDDQMSFVRLLVYSNEFDMEGLVATTSTWLRNTTNPHTLKEIIDAYAKVRPNLMLHAPGWPEAARLRDLVVTGQPRYGMAAVGPDRMSPGAQAIVAAVDRPDSRPVWISIWAGANTLAQALAHVRATRVPEAVDAFVAKLRVYAISDQDDAGPWIRREFPGLFYIVQPSTPDSADYYYATWTGISGDVYYRNGEGADGTTVTNAWLDTHIRSKGPLGTHYPRFAFIMEGDTPAFLGLVNNGLNSPAHPGWGGWGGRYIYRKPYGETRSIWTQGGHVGGGPSSQDEVVGVDGKPHVSDQATVWRWRTAFQNDFSARMDWTVEPFSKANHNPIAIVNGIEGSRPIVVDAEVGKPVILDAGASRDPDGQALHFRWISYPEAGYTLGRHMAGITLSNAEGPTTTIIPKSVCRPGWLPENMKCKDGVAHIVLEVTDTGTLPLTTYRRVILNVRASVQ
nr:DUF1593 domain-containing protein [Duganella sp. SG902]